MGEGSAKLALTVGDPAGVGPEIISKWAQSAPDRLLESVEVIAHKKFLDSLPRALSKREVGQPDFSPIPGVPSAEGSRVALEALEVAARGCSERKYFAATTAPISKFEMRKVGFKYAGHTEFFAGAWGGEPVMCFAGEKLIVALVTWHSPIKEIPFLINDKNISRAVECSARLAQKTLGIDSPRVAVCGLNPHAGEEGLLGREEIEVINPLLNRLRGKSELLKNLSPALPPDTVFARILRGEFDCSVAMYHDQGLAPLKALEFDSAVNVTMNLKYVRTSPDHGTGYSIAGKGIASEKSLSRAISLAFKLSQ